MFEYHSLLSSYQFRRNLGDGRGNTRYFTIDDCDAAVRELHRIVVALAHERGLAVSDDKLCDIRRNEQGWPTGATAEDLRENIKSTREVLDALREARVDYQEVLSGRFSLAGYLLDQGTWHCQILDSERLVAFRWSEHYTGVNR